MSGASSPIRAVIFDLGGVILGSPMPAIAALERRWGMAEGSMTKVISETGPDGAWARHERGELGFEAFAAALEEEFSDRGFEIDARALIDAIEEAIEIRPQMLEAVTRIRQAGFKVAALTNNWEPVGDGSLIGHFDAFVESVTEGVRKPEHEIYRRCLERLGVAAGEAVMLDDLGPNLEPARAMGMTTIKVERLDQALAELGAVLGLDLVHHDRPAR